MMGRGKTSLCIALAGLGMRFFTALPVLLIAGSAQAQLDITDWTGSFVGTATRFEGPGRWFFETTTPLGTREVILVPGGTGFSNLVNGMQILSTNGIIGGGVQTATSTT